MSRIDYLLNCIEKGTMPDLTPETNEELRLMKLAKGICGGGASAGGGVSIPSISFTHSKGLDNMYSITVDVNDEILFSKYNTGENAHDFIISEEDFNKLEEFIINPCFITVVDRYEFVDYFNVPYHYYEGEHYGYVFTYNGTFGEFFIGREF